MSTGHRDDHDDHDDRPIEELALLREEPGASLVGRVRRAIDRRTTAAQVIELAWLVPKTLAVEYLKLVVGLVRPDEERERGDAPPRDGR